MTTSKALPPEKHIIKVCSIGRPKPGGSTECTNPGTADVEARKAEDASVAMLSSSKPPHLTGSTAWVHAVSSSDVFDMAERALRKSISNLKDLAEAPQSVLRSKTRSLGMAKELWSRNRASCEHRKCNHRTQKMLLIWLKKHAGVPMLLLHLHHKEVNPEQEFVDPTRSKRDVRLRTDRLPHTYPHLI